VLARHPNGIRGMSFFQKDVSKLHLPPFVDTISIRAKSTGRRVRYIVCNNKSTLLYLANLGCIEMHPWLSRTKRLNRPELMVIDLDPGRVPFEQVVAVARRVQKIVAAAGVRSFVKTSGKTGLHVCIPLHGKYEYEQVRMVARLLVRRVNAELPRTTTLAQRIANRRNRVYLDYARNSFGQTVAAPYSLRAHPGASVSTPLPWSDLRSSTRPGQFNIRSVFRRLAHGDIWRGAFQGGVNLNRLERKLRATDEESKRKKPVKPRRHSKHKRSTTRRRRPARRRRLPARRRRIRTKRSRSRRG
jgi:bifunctional non-homologous end joining protein LigD